MQFPGMEDDFLNAEVHPSGAETGFPRTEAGIPKAEARFPCTEAKIPKAEGEFPKAEARFPLIDGTFRKATVFVYSVFPDTNQFGNKGNNLPYWQWMLGVYEVDK